LRSLINDRNAKAKTIWRAKIVLATADGHGTNEIMRRTGMSKPAVWRWQERYIEEGVEGLLRDKTRPSRIPPLSEAVKLAVLTKTATEEPADATHWSRASMAEAIGISPSSVGRIWAEAGLKPHLVKRFKISNDPQFEEKSPTLSGFTSILRSERLCSASMRRARSRRSTAPSQACRLRRDGPRP
jgi:transposase